MAEKAEDKRIGKSKDKMKSALMKLLVKKPMGDITVIQICLAANVTRLTFYKYYEDKFALAEEMFRDMAAVTDKRFRELQEANNAEHDPALSYCNLLDCIVDLFYTKNPMLPFSLRRAVGLHLRGKTREDAGQRDPCKGQAPDPGDHHGQYREGGPDVGRPGLTGGAPLVCVRR